MKSEISHWMPLVTRCPLSWFPDFLYVRITFHNFEELYSIRRQLFKRFWWKKAFMEEIALDVMNLFPNAQQVEVALLFNRHKVVVEAFRGTC